MEPSLGEDQSGLLERNRVHQDPQNQYMDKIVDVSAAMHRKVTRNQTTHRKSSDKETQQVNLGWTSDTVNAHIDFFLRHWKRRLTRKSP